MPTWSLVSRALSFLRPCLQLMSTLRSVVSSLPWLSLKSCRPVASGLQRMSLCRLPQSCDFPAGCLPLLRVALQLSLWSLLAPPSVSQCVPFPPVCWRLRMATGLFPRIFLNLLSPETCLCALCSLSLPSHPFLIVLISFGFGLVLV